MTKQQMIIPDEGESKIDLFRKREIRKVMHENEWWFSVKDILEALVDTTDGNRYSRGLRERDPGLKTGWAEITQTLLFKNEKGGTQKTTFIDIEGVFRMIQSVPTEKAEPFKKWLARVGFERLQEVQDPSLAVKRAVTLYRVKGYDDEWIDARIRNKVSRELLTAEWQNHGVVEYSGLLTDAITVNTFGISIKEYKRVKGLKSQNLRDNMAPIELTLTTLGEQTTTEIIKATNPEGLKEHMKTAKQGGKIAGDARLKIEDAIGKPVVSERNYLTELQRKNNTQLDSNLDKTLQSLLDVNRDK